ncbi:MAG: regulatory protein RecX [Candidatus Methylomirabilaceae bacterium]
MAHLPAGVRITRIRSSNRDPSIRVVDIEGAGRFRLDVKTVDALALNEGAEVDTRLAGRIAGAAEHRHAREIALRLLQRRLRSRAELETGLRRRGVSRVVSIGVIGDLAREGWIDDARFARAWVRDRLALRPSGRRRLVAELISRGVSPATAEDAVASMLTPQGEEDLALSQARARFRRTQRLPPYVARRRLVGWLRRRGFGQAAIARVLRMVQGTAADEESSHASA